MDVVVIVVSCFPNRCFEARDFKFVTLVGHSKSQPMDDKLPWSGCGCRHVANFKFWVPQSYLWNG